jgi:hypothetical protein
MGSINKKGILYSAVALSVIILVGLFYDHVDMLIAWSYQSWFDIFINPDRDILLRYVDIQQLEGTFISFLTYFINPADVNLSQVKNIDINLFNEIYLPISIYSVIASFFLIKDKKTPIIIGLVLLIILWLKNLIVVYDNYSYPEYALVELPRVISGFVYYSNSLIEKVGQSLSLMMATVALVVLLALNAMGTDE